MELTQLRTFRTVAELLNLTRAAERLHLTQSAVSHQIKALELELGEPLFIRTKRGVKLSPAGKGALEYVERILADADALKEQLGGKEYAPTGRVRVAAATQALVHLFAPLFETFMRLHPQIELSFRTTVTTSQTVSDILDGAADVGFASLAVYSPALRVVELFEDELALTIAGGHRWAGRKSVEASEIRQERLILFERGSSIRYVTDDFLRKVSVRPGMAMESNDTYFIKLMVERGFGISLLPTWAIREEVQDGRLARVAIEGHQLCRSIAMVSLGNYQSAPTKSFLEYVTKHQPELQERAR